MNLYTIWDFDHNDKILTTHQKHSEAHQRVADYKLRNTAIGLQWEAWSEYKRDHFYLQDKPA